MFFPATQDAYHGGILGILFNFKFFSSFCLLLVARTGVVWKLGFWDWFGTHAYGAAAGMDEST